MSVYGGDEPMPKREDSPLDGKNFYAIGKKASESYLSLCSSRTVKTTSLRLFNIYGPGQNLENLNQGMLSIYLAQALNNDKIIVKGALDRSIKSLNQIGGKFDGAVLNAVDESITYGSGYYYSYYQYYYGEK